jgi:hypothetical protein
MPQEIGQDYKTLVPVFSDDASIEEAFRMYHYGVANFNNLNESPNSIQGHLREVNRRVDEANQRITDFSVVFLEAESRADAPNVITPENNTTVPLTVRAAPSQVSDLQRFETSSGTRIATIYPDGFASFQGYLGIGINTKPQSSTGISMFLSQPTHRGITIRGANNHTGNLQEWQNNQGTSLARVSANGTVFSKNSEVVNLIDSQTVKNKTIQDSTIENSTINNTVFNNAVARIAIEQRQASFTLQLSDQGKLLEANVSVANTVSIPQDSSVNFAIGTNITILQVGTGQTTIQASNPSLTQVVGTPGTKIRAQWSIATLIKRAPNSWVVIGDVVN